MIALPLSELINESFMLGLFPNSLKVACVTPIHKAGDTSAAINFRPISKLPLLCEVFERCMYNRLVSFFSKFDILSQQQFGFRKGLSCGDAINKLLSYVYSAINERRYVISIFLDLRKPYMIY